MLECNLPLIHRKDFFNEDLRKYFIHAIKYYSAL